MKKDKSFLKIPINRIFALVLLDVMSIIVAAFAALYIRFDFSFTAIPIQYLRMFEEIIPYNIAMSLLFFVVWKLYKSVWRYASATELVNIIFATTCAAIAQVVLCYAMHLYMPRSYYVIYWFLLSVLICGIRFSYRILRIVNMKRTSLTEKNTSKNVMQF